MPVSATAFDSASGRQWRSRKDRPCDHCRVQKHACVIAVKGEPCRACQQREQPCTFDLPPTTRVRKPPTNATGSSETHNRSDRSPVPSISHGYSSRDGSQTNGDSPNAPQTSNHPPVMTLPGILNIPPNIAMRPQAPPSLLFQGHPGPLHPPQPYNQTIIPPALGRRPLHTSLRSIRQNLTTDSQNHVPAQHSGGPIQSLYTRPEELVSLDAGAKEEENQYLNPEAFAELTLEDVKDTADSGETVAYRQVSSDHTKPTFFIRNPTLIYGLTQAGGAAFFQRACEIIGYEWPPRLLPLFLQKTVAAFPIVDSRRLQAYLTDQSQTPSAPYALFSAILAHMTTYISEIRPHHKQLWVQVLLAMEDEFRLPRIQTVQLALLILTSRPAINSGQNTILTARAIGTAQLIGLHIDPTDWKLPRWERNLRKRVMWGLLIHDKWRALVFGRPSNLHNSNFSVAVPTIEDMDPDTNPTADEQDSMRSFCGMCRLTLILDDLLLEFYNVQASLNPQRGPTRLRILEGISEDLENFGRGLPESFRIDRAKATPATGVRSLQLSQLGLSLSIVRLSLGALQDTPSANVLQALQMGYEACLPVVEFLEMISDADAAMFWIPYAPYHIISCASLILRIMILAKRQDSPLRVSCGNLLARMISTLTAAHHGYSWDVASLALDRIAIIIASVEGELPEVSPLRTTFSQHIQQSAPLRARPTQAKTENHHTPPPMKESMAHSQPPPDNIPIMSDGLWWMHNDITNFPENFNWTLDGFAQFAANDAAHGPGMF